MIGVELSRHGFCKMSEKTVKVSHLLCTLGLFVVLQIGALESRPNDGQTFACLQLVGERQQTRLLHVLLCICADQHQQLWPTGRAKQRAEEEVKQRQTEKKS